MIRIPASKEYLTMQCRSCSAETVRLVLDLGSQPNANRLIKADAPPEPTYPLRLGYCETCTLLQIDHTIPRDDMFRNYVYVSGTTTTLATHFAETTNRLVGTYKVRQHDLVVDIGSNDGTWLETWRGQATGVGVEPSFNVSEMAMARGIYTVNRYFDADTAAMIKRVHGPAKIITSAGSFFHMEDLHGACEGVRDLLADDGVFVCQAISGEDMIHGNAFDQVLHEHLCYYTTKSFGPLMARHGLELFESHHHSIHGGTWEYHVRRDQGLSGGAFVHTSYEDCAAFADRIAVLQDDLLSILHDYKRQGKTVWAYGAPGKGGTLLNSFGIGPDLVSCATEANPLKYGLCIPGCRIPIVPETTEKPDAFLVLAWNFLSEFIDKEVNWLSRGGEFIVPVPRVRIIGSKDQLS